jgi:uncharacterized membrane protein YfcA
VLGGAIAAVSGFGIGSLLTPLLILTLPADVAVAVVALPHAWATTLRLWRLRTDVHGPTFRQFGVASAAGGLAGALLQGRLASTALTLVLAALLLLAGTTELIRRPLPLPAGATWRLLTGALSGAFGGLVGNQGGIRAAALLGFRLSPAQIVATATASALLVDFARVPVYLVTRGGAIAAHARLGLFLAAGVTLGTLLGVPLLARIPTPLYRRLLGALLLGLGLFLAISAA